MKIGIASPIAVSSLQKYLNPDLKEEYLHLGFGGPAVTNLIGGLIENGNKVSVYTLDSRITSRLVLRGENLTVFMGHRRPEGRYRMLDLFGQEAVQIEQLIRADKPDFVNAHWTYEYALGAINSGFPHLLTFRDNASEILRLQKDLYRLVRFMVDYKVRKKGRFFNVNSIYLQNKLSGFRPNLPVVPNSINDAYLSETGKEHPAGIFRIISIANPFDRLKNTHTALKAFKILRHKYGGRVEYHLAGNNYGPGGRAEKWAAEHGCTEGVFFKGSISHTNLMSRLREYDVLLHPSLEESFGNTLVEGMGCGLPVIGGKDSGAVPWVLDYGKKGILVDVTSETEIAQALERLVLDGDLYRSLSEGGIVYVKESFTSRQVARQYEDLYRRILESTGKEVYSSREVLI